MTSRLLSQQQQQQQQQQSTQSTQSIHPPLQRPQLWCSESGGAYASGADNATNVFLSAFWYLDELGQMALMSHAVHCRQSLMGGDYSMLTRHADAVTGKVTFTPLPDYYATRIWATLMGPRVLAARLKTTARAKSSSSSSVSYTACRETDGRAFAHCHPAGDGSVSVLVLNSCSTHELVVKVHKSAPWSTVTRKEYHFTAWGDSPEELGLGATSRVALNGRLLEGFSPEMSGQPVDDPGSYPMVLAPASYAFFVFDANHSACLKDERITIFPRPTTFRSNSRQVL
mmetsp:Transcript_26769/g.36785  ORF Transcript_26769/g.36785 Transcript_26769/m.36785 type:complete len:285 (-) Transcript_26769:357-1211(-)